MRKAYGSNILLKLTSSIISLALGAQIGYIYRYQYTFIWLASSLLIFLFNYWYIIPFLLVYVLPKIEQLVKYWFKLIDFFSNKSLRPHSIKLRQALPSTWLFESNQKLWPIESIRIMLKYGSIGPAIYCGYKIYSYLFFGISFNICIALNIIILITTTLWRILEAIDRDLYPLLFVIIIQYYFMPIKSLLNIPLTLILPSFLFPLLNNLLVHNSIKEFIQNITLLNFRTFFESNQYYKQSYREFIHLFITFYLIYHVLISYLVNDVHWLLTIIMISFLSIYLYTNLIYLISFQPNIIMFIFSLLIMSKYVLYKRNEDHFISKYFLLTVLLTVYFAVVYPLLYHILRYSIMKSQPRIGLKLKLFRERITLKTVNLIKTYFSLTYVHEPTKYFILHLSNILIVLCILAIFPMNIFLRLILSLLSYLLIGQLLLTHGLQSLSMLTSLFTSIIISSYAYTCYNNSLILAMSIAVISFICTLVIIFPIIYDFTQYIFIYLPFVQYLDDILQTLYSYSWSYFNTFWLHIEENVREVKLQIEQSRINVLRHPTNE